MLKLIENFWRPLKFTVTYCNRFGMCQDYYDKFEYNNLEDATKRQDYLFNLSADDLLKEGFKFVPNYIRMEQVTSPNPIRRLLNWCGSKRMYKIFGVWI